MVRMDARHLLKGSIKMQWRSIGPGGGGYYQALATAPGNPDRVYCAIDVGLPYVSDDGGLTWREIGLGLRQQSHLAQRQIIRIAVSYQDPDVAYFVTLAGGIWRTADGGQSYTRVGAIESTGGYHSGHLALISPVNHDHVTFYAGGRFWFTTNGRELWPIDTPTGMKAPVATAIVCSADGQNVSLWIGSGSSTGSLKRLGANGWISCRMRGFPTGGFMSEEMSGRPLHSSVDWQTSQTVLLAMAKSGRVYRSADLGDNWSPVPNSPGLTKATLWVDPLDARRMIVNSHPTLGFATEDGGVTGWQPRITRQSRRGEQAGEDEMHAYDFVPGFGNRDRVFGRQGYSLFRSDDGGRTLQVCSQTRLGQQHYKSTGVEATFANWLSFDEAGRTFLYDQDCGGARSDDELATWHCLRYGVTEEPTSDHPAGLAGKSIWNLDSPAGVVHDQGKVIVWITGRTIMQSELETFSYIWGPDVWGADVAGKTQLKDRHGVYISHDGERFHFHGHYAGFPWQWNALSNAMDIDRNSSALARTMYLACPAGVFKSSDTGRTWINLTSQIANVPAIDNRYNWHRQPSLFAHVRVDPHNSRRVFATTVKRVDPPVPSSSSLSAIYLSENVGATWRPLVSPIKSCWAFSPSPVLPNLLFAADRDTGVYRSVDGGQTWQLVLALPWVTSVVPSRFNADVVYVACDAEYKWFPLAGVCRSVNGGHSWEDITGDLPHLRIMLLVEDPQTQGRLYVGTRGAGAFTLTVA